MNEGAGCIDVALGKEVTDIGQVHDDGQLRAPKVQRILGEGEGDGCVLKKWQNRQKKSKKKPNDTNWKLEEKENNLTNKKVDISKHKSTWKKENNIWKNFTVEDIVVEEDKEEHYVTKSDKAEIAEKKD